MQLTHFSFLAEGLREPPIAAQFCQALRQLRQLQVLHLNRLQLSTHTAQQLGQVISELSHLRSLVLSGGAAAISSAELYVLLNGEHHRDECHLVCSVHPLQCGAVYSQSCTRPYRCNLPMTSTTV